MGLSIQDQLLKAGLVSKSQASKANKDKQKRAYQQRNNKKTQVSETEKQRQKEQLDRAAKDRELNSKLSESIKQRETAAQIKQLVEKNRVSRSNDEADIAFGFENKGKIKKIYVSSEVHNKIISGRLDIVNYNGVFELVPHAIAVKIKQRNPALVIEISKEVVPDEDDPYKDYQVPDDLQW